MYSLWGMRTPLILPVSKKASETLFSSGGLKLDHKTIAEFRRRNNTALQKVLNAHSLSFGVGNFIAILGQCRIDMPVDEHHVCNSRIQIAALSLVIRRNVIIRIGLLYKQHVIV